MAARTLASRAGSIPPPVLVDLLGPGALLVAIDHLRDQLLDAESPLTLMWPASYASL